MENEGISRDLVKLKIKFGGQTIPLSMVVNSTIAELKALLQSSTNILPRRQKLIHKGKILEDSKTLKASNFTNGSKIMLMASQGLHQGEGPKLKDALCKTRIERWKVTGVIDLSETHLKAIPDEVWDCGSSARVLDLNKNYICDIPYKIGCMTAIQKLILSGNDISDDSINWLGLRELTSLKYLCLNQNHLTDFPTHLRAFDSLEQLHVAGNKLESLPIEIGLLTQLQILNASNNRITTIPYHIGYCYALIEVDLSANLLVELPETFGNLTKLQALHLGNNGLKSLPHTLLTSCVELSTLDLHGTEITMDMLRWSEGWEEFNERRRLKYQKQLDFRAGGSAEFDEGADKN